jgi:ABC-type nitrate/sulfonate/bicarbonate transport system substrate-binding protein
MVESLQSSEIDVAIGLTEGWVNALARLNDSAKFKIVCTYVDSPLRWAISTGAKRGLNVGDLAKGAKIGVSRIGSGSYVMPFVLADKRGWLAELGEGEQPFEFVVLDDFASLRAAVNDGRADAFMWEYFTSKKYYDNGEIAHIGDIYTPWASWMIVANDPKSEQVKDLIAKLQQGINLLKWDSRRTVKHISTNLDYSKEDATSWLETVEFASLKESDRDVTENAVKHTIDILRKAGVISQAALSPTDIMAP